MKKMKVRTLCSMDCKAQKKRTVAWLAVMHRQTPISDSQAGIRWIYAHSLTWHDESFRTQHLCDQAIAASIITRTCLSTNILCSIYSATITSSRDKSAAACVDCILARTIEFFKHAEQVDNLQTWASSSASLVLAVVSHECHNQLLTAACNAPDNLNMKFMPATCTQIRVCMSFDSMSALETIWLQGNYSAMVLLMLASFTQYV